MRALGVDIGGSKIKAAPVGVTAGKLLAERLKLEAPQPSTPMAVAGVVAELARSFIAGCGFYVDRPISFPGDSR